MHINIFHLPLYCITEFEVALDNSVLEKTSQLQTSSTEEITVARSRVVDNFCSSVSASVLASVSASVSAGQYCAAKCSENHVWYRAQIAEVGQDGLVLVLFRDYGNFAYVEERNLVDGVGCIPAGEEKDVYLAEAAAAGNANLQSEENDSDIEAAVVVGTSVEGKCVKSEHGKDGAACEVMVEVDELESLDSLGGRLVDLGMQQQCSTETPIEDVLRDGEPTLEKTREVSCNICEGGSCLAIWGEDGVLYRATLKTWLPDGLKAEVHFIDYDNEDEVGIENIFRDYSCVPGEVLQSDQVDFNVGAHIRLLLASRIC